jgi:hypothetical protein
VELPKPLSESLLPVSFKHPKVPPRFTSNAIRTIRNVSREQLIAVPVRPDVPKKTPMSSKQFSVPVLLLMIQEIARARVPTRTRPITVCAVTNFAPSTITIVSPELTSVVLARPLARD